MRRAIACLTVLLASTACEVPRYQGPMVQALPDGFIGEPEAGYQRELFRDRILERDAYVVTASTEFSGIYIRKLDGNTMRTDVVAAQEAARASRNDPQVSYGPIEDIRIDGRAAWAWMEETRDPNGLQFVDYRAVVPYDSISYAIEFVTGDPWWKTRPDSMRAVTQSFAIGRVEWNMPFVIGSVVVLALLLRSFAGKFGGKVPGQDYNLKTYKKPEKEGEPGPGKGGPASAEPLAGGPEGAPVEGSPPGGERNL